MLRDGGDRESVNFIRNLNFAPNALVATADGDLISIGGVGQGPMLGGPDSVKGG